MPAASYRDHLDTLMTRSAAALQRGGFDHLLIASGVEKYHFLDDRPYPFQVNPHFKHWLPLTAHPHSWLAITPGRRPLLAYYQPDDYWHLPPSAPQGEWVEHFDVRVIREPAEAAQHLPPAARSAILGEADAALPGFAPNNPERVLAHLHWHRAFKTPFEMSKLRSASRRAVRGHRFAEAAFRAGESELGIHRAYLAATAHNDLDLPYGNIVALNEHGAVLHYQYQRAEKPEAHRAFLIDAGASCDGYAADITRTYGNGDAAFEGLFAAVDRVQRDLASRVRAGTDYATLHVDCHRQLGGVLRELDIVRMTPDAMLDTGVTSTFFPHGLGHLLGLQVHDVGGFQRDENGGNVARPAGHPYLRLTRTLAPGMVVTIEPGIYFIDTLLAKLRASEHAHAVNWNAIEHLRGFGGVRIEDDVVCTQGAPENLTREAFAAQG
ncbi:MAG: Xaa-Pro dipeptidase [Chiayiivirga sp.]|jgi:Xaa-Pro dipeptidase|uniref:Xaa-Pro dipeptidase n=1 Tax=Chiayiivirga sp. TaxID=2041042 RepID=UPI0025BACA3B|nr:Xaa-Pro dipeptidase [Chiayiivirga sp.]MCI1730575.1 Xaa-Pro dipeptidase [Chiayiivirga sp.]